MSNKIFDYILGNDEGASVRELTEAGFGDTEEVSAELTTLIKAGQAYRRERRVFENKKDTGTFETRYYATEQIESAKKSKSK